MRKGRGAMFKQSKNILLLIYNYEVWAEQQSAECTPASCRALFAFDVFFVCGAS